MARETFDRQINQVRDEILLLGSMVEQAMLSAVDSLKQRNINVAASVLKSDSQINEKRYAIENAILIIIATQQPIAHDLRLLAAMLEIITELERMGDYAKGIARITINLGDADVPIPIREISQMADKSVSMLHRALSAFISENARQATLIPREDDEVDALYNNVYHQVMNYMIKNPDCIDTVNSLLWVAHNIERMADRVTNICERTVFINTGELLEMDSSDDEEQD